MVATLSRIDAKLASLSRETAAIETRLAELDETTRTLAGAGLTGRTGAAWSAVAPKAGELWRSFLVLRARVQEAAGIRGTGGALDREQLEDLSHRLFDASVTLPEAPSALLSTVLVDTSRVVSMDRVVAMLSALYEEVATVANRIVGAWESLQPRVAELDAALAAVDAEAGRARVPLPAAVASLRDRLGTVRATLAHDPLAVDGAELAGLVGRAAEAGVALHDLVAARDGLGARLASSSSSLDGLGRALDGAIALRAEVAVRIAGAAERLPDPAPLAGRLPELRARLERAAAGAADWQTASEELDGLEAQAAAVRAAIHRVVTAANQELEGRNRLRGLLDGYRARARAVGWGEDAAVASLYERAHEALYTAPCDVGAAAVLVDAYQLAVRRRRDR